jgi:hypothetical protein
MSWNGRKGAAARQSPRKCTNHPPRPGARRLMRSVKGVLNNMRMGSAQDLRMTLLFMPSFPIASGTHRHLETSRRGPRPSDQPPESAFHPETGRLGATRTPHRLPARRPRFDVVAVQRACGGAPVTLPRRRRSPSD